MALELKPQYVHPMDHYMVIGGKNDGRRLTMRQDQVYTFDPATAFHAGRYGVVAGVYESPSSRRPN